MVGVNVAGLVLARGATRRPELAVRASLGAGRARLVRQLFTESLVLAFAGGLAGVLVARVSLAALIAMLPGLPEGARINLVVLGGSVLFTVVTGVAVGLAPALRLSKIRAEALSSRIAHAPLRRRGGQVLIAAEVTLAIVLLTCAAGVIREVVRRLSPDLGVNLDRLLVMEVAPLDRSSESLTAYYPALLEALRAHPDIEAAGASQSFPLDSTVWGRAVGTGRDSVRVRIRRVLPGYLDAMGLPPRQGRLLVEPDRSAALPAVVISEEAARVLFPDGPAVGRQLRRGRSEYSVVGVVGNTRLEGQAAMTSFAVGENPGPDDGSAPQIYEVFGREVRVPVTVVVRARGSQPAIERGLREVVRTLGPRAVVSRIRTGADAYWSMAIASRARQATLLGLFSSLGLILALLGVFGATAYAVARRTPEIGVRLALGASPARVVRGVVRDSVMPAAIGVVLGLGTTMVLARLVPSVLYVEFLAGDVAMRAVVAVLLGAMAGLAAWIPARRAGRIDPVSALRAE